MAFFLAERTAEPYGGKAAGGALLSLSVESWSALKRLMLEVGCWVRVSHADWAVPSAWSGALRRQPVRGEPATGASDEPSLYPTLPLICPLGSRTVFYVLIFYPLLLYKILHPSSFHRENTTPFKEKSVTVKKTEDNRTTTKKPRRQKKGLENSEIIAMANICGFLLFFFPFKRWVLLCGLLPQAPKCWQYSCVPPWLMSQPVSAVLVFQALDFIWWLSF